MGYFRRICLLVPLIILVLGGCSQPQYHDTFVEYGDAKYYEAYYQKIREPKALACGFPKNWLSKETDAGNSCTRSHMNPEDAHHLVSRERKLGKHYPPKTIEEAKAQALWMCDWVLKEWNDGKIPADKECRIYAVNNQIQPWVSEMKTARNEAGLVDNYTPTDHDAYNTAFMMVVMQGATMAATGGGNSSVPIVMPSGGDENSELLLGVVQAGAAGWEAGSGNFNVPTMSQYTPPPTTSISNPSTSPQATATSSGEHPLNSFVEIFSDKFDWCRAPSNTCNVDHLIKIKDDKGVVGGEFGISIRPVSADTEKNSLDYKVYLVNRSLCKLHLYSSTITHARKGPSTWDIGSVFLEPRETRESKLKTFSFDKEWSGRAEISVSGQLSDCHYPSQ